MCYCYRVKCNKCGRQTECSINTCCYSSRNVPTRYTKCHWCKKEDGEVKSGCFITSAACGVLGKADNCAELTALRKFRDTWMMETPDRSRYVNKYYEVAPDIVSNIDSRPDAKDVYLSIWDSHITPALDKIASGDDEGAFDTYRDMVESLAARYGRGGN